MSKIRNKTILTVFNEKDQIVGIKIIDKELTELMKEKFDVKCELTDVIDIRPEQNKGE